MTPRVGSPRKAFESNSFAVHELLLDRWDVLSNAYHVTERTERTLEVKEKEKGRCLSDFWSASQPYSQTAIQELAANVPKEGPRDISECGMTGNILEYYLA